MPFSLGTKPLTFFFFFFFLDFGLFFFCFFLIDLDWLIDKKKLPLVHFIFWVPWAQAGLVPTTGVTEG